MDNKSCAVCTHAMPINGSDWVECRKYPPTGTADTLSGFPLSLLTYLDCGSTALAPSTGLAARSAPEGVGNWRKAVVVRAQQAAAARRRSKWRQVFEVDAAGLLLLSPVAVGDDDDGAMAPCVTCYVKHSVVSERGVCSVLGVKREAKRRKGWPTPATNGKGNFPMFVTLRSPCFECFELSVFFFVSLFLCFG